MREIDFNCVTVISNKASGDATIRRDSTAKDNTKTGVSENQQIIIKKPSSTRIVNSNANADKNMKKCTKDSAAENRRDSLQLIQLTREKKTLEAKLRSINGALEAERRKKQQTRMYNPSIEVPRM